MNYLKLVNQPAFMQLEKKGFMMCQFLEEYVFNFRLIKIENRR